MAALKRYIRMQCMDLEFELSGCNREVAALHRSDHYTQAPL